jgi:hypothetical protein
MFNPPCLRAESDDYVQLHASDRRSGDLFEIFNRALNKRYAISAGASFF